MENKLENGAGKDISIIAEMEPITVFDCQDQIYIEKIVIKEALPDSFSESNQLIFSLQNKPLSVDVSSQFYEFEQSDRTRVSAESLKVECEVEKGNLVIKIPQSDPQKLEKITISDVCIRKNTEYVLLSTYSLYVCSDIEAEKKSIISDFMEVIQYIPPIEKEKLDIRIKLDENTFIVNDIEKKVRVPAYISANGYTMIPIREISEIFPGIHVIWDRINKKADIVNKEHIYTVFAESDTLYRRGIPLYSLENNVDIQNGRMFVSLRDICQICGIPNEDIFWDNNTRTVTINTEV